MKNPDARPGFRGRSLQALMSQKGGEVKVSVVAGPRGDVEALLQIGRSDLA